MRERMEAGGPTSLVLSCRRENAAPQGGPWEAGKERGHTLPRKRLAGLQGCAGTACGQQRQRWTELGGPRGGSWGGQGGDRMQGSAETRVCSAASGAALSMSQGLPGGRVPRAREGDSHPAGELQSWATLPPALLLSEDAPVSHPGCEIHTHVSLCVSACRGCVNPGSVFPVCTLTCVILKYVNPYSS